MKILAIETSCDETALALIEGKKEKSGMSFSVLGDAMYSQIKIHKQYGGVFPMVAKREHARTLTPLLKEVLKQTNGSKNSPAQIFSKEKFRRVKKILEREAGLAKELIHYLEETAKPKIDKIAVTVGPGLEPALWVGINFAKALSIAWDIPIVPVNHMEGHILSALLEKRGRDNLNFKISNLKFPILALLISGGHTELVLAKKIGSYKILGETRDDAVGEAFDKVARMLGLPYPGGPQISLLAERARNRRGRDADLTRKKDKIILPRPMLHSNDLDFSFAGLKTAVLYTLKKLEKNNFGDVPRLVRISPRLKKEMALEFEDASTEVLISKTKKATLITKAKTLVIGGGVSANINIRKEFAKLMKENFSSVKLFVPEQKLSTDNAVMIGLSAFFKKEKLGPMTRAWRNLSADGNLRLN